MCPLLFTLRVAQQHHRGDLLRYIIACFTPKHITRHTGKDCTVMMPKFKVASRSLILSMVDCILGCELKLFCIHTGRGKSFRAEERAHASENAFDFIQLVSAVSGRVP
jgi:hypothetical protein